jgi:FtsZ-binding cell division protein ZapB
MKDGSCPWTYLKEMCEGGACPWEVFYMIQADYNSTKLALEMVKEENKKLQLDYATRGDIVEGLKETITTLKEEVEGFPEKLKLVRANAALEFNVKLNQAVAELGDKYHEKLKEENKKLKEENEKLQEELEKVKKI